MKFLSKEEKKHEKGFAQLCALALIGTMTLTACGKKAEDGKTEDGKTKIRFATWDVADDIDYQQEFVDEFNASQDKIEVTLEA